MKVDENFIVSYNNDNALPDMKLGVNDIQNIMQLRIGR